MNRVELESFIKSFLLFFISISLLVTAIFYLQYQQDVKNMQDNVFNKMKLCSFDLKCSDLKMEFVSKESRLEPYTLYKENGTLYSYFTIARSENYLLKLTMEKTNYLKEMDAIKDGFILKSSLTLFVVLLLSGLFSIYTLHPLRKALLFTQELIKDILHDFNTPLSALRLNLSMLQKEAEPNAKLKRMEQSVQTILDLQSNLRSYLLGSAQQKEIFDLQEIVFERIEQIQKLFPLIEFRADIGKKELTCNKEAFVRILDNLLSNAAKYNKKNGFVAIILNNDILEIRDSGIGIKEPKRAFERFYKEHERGMGIGLHIVKKLCDELDIHISIKSKVNEGTSVFLQLQNC